MAGQLKVTIIRAQGLKPLNHFTGDELYAVCEIIHADPHQKSTKFETKVQQGSLAEALSTVGSLDPEWNETQIMRNWVPGDSLKFTCYDKGLLGSKIEGHTELPSEYFEQEGFAGTLPISGLEHATLEVQVVPMNAPQQQQEQTYGAPPQHVDNNAPAQHHEQDAAQAQNQQHDQSLGQPYQLRVQIVHAEGLHHMNHFCADNVYCVCEVKHADKHAKPTKLQTQSVTMPKTEDNVVWNEEHIIEQWHVGDSLEFSVYDKGLLSSRMEAKAILASEYFFPAGFEGEVPFDGLPGGVLFLSVVPEEPAEAGQAAAPTYAAPQAPVQAPELPPGSRMIGEPRHIGITYGPLPGAMGQVMQQPAVAAPQTFVHPGATQEFAVSAHPHMQQQATYAPHMQQQATYAPHMQQQVTYGAPPSTMAPTTMMASAMPTMMAPTVMPTMSYGALPTMANGVQHAAGTMSYGAPAFPANYGQHVQR